MGLNEVHDSEIDKMGHICCLTYTVKTFPGLRTDMREEKSRQDTRFLSQLIEKIIRVINGGSKYRKSTFQKECQGFCTGIQYRDFGV